MQAMTPLTGCEKCGAAVWADDVFKTVAIPKAPGHLALIFKCPRCNESGRVAAPQETWDSAQASAEKRSAAHKDALMAARIDIASIESVDDLVAEWSTSVPIREAVMNQCKCESCQRRLYEA